MKRELIELTVCSICKKPEWDCTCPYCYHCDSHNCTCKPGCEKCKQYKQD